MRAVIVDVLAGQDAAATWAANRSCNKRICEEHTFVNHQFFQFWHRGQATEYHIYGEVDTCWID